MAAPKISVVIPTMNEEESIAEVMDAVNAAIEEIGSGEVLIVDTNSKDRTREIATEKGARVIDEPRRGYGRAYKTGFANAEGELIATLDADCTYPAEEIPRLVKMLEDEGLDYITCDRLKMMEEGAMTGEHKFGNWALKFTMNLLFGMRLSDSQTGMWVFKREILDKLDLTSDGMPLSEEIKIEAFRNKDVKAKEVSVPYRPRKGEVKLNSWRDGRKNWFFLWKKRFGMAKRES